MTNPSAPFLGHTHKMANGVKVALTPEEVAYFEADEQEFLTVVKPAQVAEQQRRHDLTAAAQELTDLLRSETSAQIDSWFSSVQTPEQIRDVVKTLAKIVALRT